MSDADREWTIEHAGEQLYDSSACSTTAEKRQDMATDRDRPDNRRTREWRETFQTLEAGELIRAALTPAGWRLTLGDD
jgi:hypothetical protein